MTSMASTLLEQNFVHSSRRGGRSEVVGYRTRARARASARARGRAGGRALAILRAGPGRERPGIEKSTVFN